MTTPRHGDEAVQALEWAYGVLSTSALLAEALATTVGTLPDHVWSDPAPAGAPEPVVVLTVQEPLDTNAVGPGARLKTRVPLNVRVVGRGTAYDPLAAPARAVYAELHGRAGDPIPGGGTVLTCLRQAALMYPEDSGGIQYRHLGHQFQVEID